MPTYEYKCPKCGHRFDVFQKITARPGAPCPKCGTRAERLISGGTGVLFKGSGFYETDYKRPSEKARHKKETGEKSGEKPAEKPAPSTPDASKPKPKAD